jgi:solute carrier family 25 thiamine pyrophosphate transporter 19
MSGLVSKMGVYPLDLIKKRRQVQSKLLWEKSLIHYTHSQNSISLLQTIAQIHKQEGILGFYRGVVPALLKSVPTSMTTFLVFGFCQRCFSTKEA